MELQLIVHSQAAEYENEGPRFDVINAKNTTGSHLHRVLQTLAVCCCFSLAFGSIFQVGCTSYKVCKSFPPCRGATIQLSFLRSFDTSRFGFGQLLASKAPGEPGQGLSGVSNVLRLPFKASLDLISARTQKVFEQQVTLAGDLAHGQTMLTMAWG